jgi:N6-L-threonylcarbamoyladenine synthase
MSQGQSSNMKSPKYVLGIETSCDDTSVAILHNNLEHQKVEVISHLYFSQEVLLRKWGGVVPELAARNHLLKLAPLIESAFEEAKLKSSEIDLIAVTALPGLLGPLLTGINAAKTLSLLHHTPILPVNHLFAHLEAIHLSDNICYPYLGLLVSGGHSIYFLVSGPLEFKMLGSTIDDAAGEAFDKGGKLLGLGYPAGKIIDELAAHGDEKRFSFPIGLKDRNTCDLSFSGLKTALRVFIQDNPELVQDPLTLNDICASYQAAVVKALVSKLKIANQNLNLPIVVGGGVACNSKLRHEIKKQFRHAHFVEPRYCTDNAAMIANYAIRTYTEQIAFPDCLMLDAQSRYLDKQSLQEKKI